MLSMMTNEITAIDADGTETIFRKGDRVIREDGSLDIVRACFVAETLLQPYAENTYAPAVVLTNVSWEHCSHLVLDRS